MKVRLRILFLGAGALVAAFLATALPAMAAEAASENPADSTVGIVFRWLNFILVFGGAGYLIAKNGGTFFQARARGIAQSITEASAAKAESERELHSVESKIAQLDSEIAGLRESARRDSEAEAERLRVEGRAEIEKIRQAARAELEAAERAARAELQAAAAALAVERAGSLIRAGMTAPVRVRMFRTFLDELARSAN